MTSCSPIVGLRPRGRRLCNSPLQHGSEGQELVENSAASSPKPGPLQLGRGPLLCPMEGKPPYVGGRWGLRREGKRGPWGARQGRYPLPLSLLPPSLHGCVGKNWVGRQGGVSGGLGGRGTPWVLPANFLVCSPPPFLSLRYSLLFS